MRFITLVAATAALAINLCAATPIIGVASAVGAYSVDSAPVTGNATLADGASLTTDGTPSDVHLQNGVEVRLATRSAGTLYVDHAVLEQGAARVANFNGYTVNARQLEIDSDTPGTEAVIRLDKKTVEIASIGGDVKVMDGGMLTRVAAGTRMSFQQSGASPDKAQAAPASTGAAPAPKGPSDHKTLLWVIGITAAAALAIGLTAAAQGKSPF